MATNSLSVSWFSLEIYCYFLGYLLKLQWYIVCVPVWEVMRIFAVSYYPPWQWQWPAQHPHQQLSHGECIISILAERNSHYYTAKSDLLLRPINSTVEYDFTCQSVLFTHILIWRNKNFPMLLIKSYHLFVAPVCSVDDNRKNSSWHAISHYSLRIWKILPVLLKIFFLFWENNVRLHVEC